MAFKKSRLFKEFNATCNLSDGDKFREHTEKLLDHVHWSCAAQQEDTVSELPAALPPKVLSVQSTPPPRPSLTPPSNTASSATLASNTPSRYMSPQRREEDSRLYRASPTPERYQSRYTNPQPAEESSQLYRASPTPEPYQSLPTRQRNAPNTGYTPTSVRTWPVPSPGPDDGADENPMCLTPGCNARTIKRQTKYGDNAGKWFFKCESCKAWVGWSRRGTGGATENICFCGAVGSGFKGGDGVFKYICSRNICNFNYFP
ncbi:hypothetical protein K431DRAFT_305224 [Polychaeton citri CBS 116435]|uniref:Uncharacterized protein n=1 Tax=Polychaeton citri CBS 116435 TaxID=1314669 RepID=A0A9P4UNF3_9PEZI|nr:hypothetical protein K431DRAFT_305224 [Polychaeton citri CBS 116435]